MHGPYLPRIARREPETVVYRYRVAAGYGLPLEWRRALAEALVAVGAEWRPSGDATWELLLPWSTRAFGLVRREVEEQVRLRVVATADGDGCLELECLPRATHAAHAAALAAVLAVAATVWLVGG